MKVISNHPFYIRGLKVEPVEVYHGKKAIFGYRIGKFAYITDAKSIDEVEKDKLRGLDVLIVNALRDKEHFAHFTLAEALALIEEVKPRRGPPDRAQRRATVREHSLQEPPGSRHRKTPPWLWPSTEASVESASCL